MIDRAIKAINPNAEFIITNEDINSIEWLNNTTPISVADIEAKITELPTWEELDAQKKTNKANGKQKLLDLGLTEEEVKELIGL